MLVSPCPALALCPCAPLLALCLVCTVPVGTGHGETAVLGCCAPAPFTEVLYREGDVGHDCLCLKVPRSQGDPFTAISLGSMEVTWRRE